MLTVCTMLPCEFRLNAVTENFFTALFDNLDALKADEAIDLDALKAYVDKVTAEGVRKEDVMNHFWEIDNKPVEDTLYWEEVQIDMRKHK